MLKFFGACCVVVAAASVAAADLEWKYEGEWSAPATSVASSVSTGFQSSAVIDEESAAYGTSAESYFFSFMNSFDLDAQSTEFLSTKPQGMTIILR